MNYLIIHVFTLGSIYSTNINASGAEQMSEKINQMKLNRIKNPNWPEANQPAIYRRGQEFELGTYIKNKSSLIAVRVGLKLWASKWQVQLSNRSVMLPPLSTKPN